LASAAILLTGCSVKKYAINKMGDAIAGVGTSFSSDDDPDLIRAAAPFSLKLVESLIEQSPRHRGLLLAAARGFTQYSFAFVQEDGDELEDRDPAKAQELHGRAARLYLRARDYGMRGLEVKHPGFAGRLKQNPKEAAQEISRAEVPFLYWTAVPWAAALAVSHDMFMLPDIPRFEALIYRALELDEAFDEGGIHVFLIAYEISRMNGGADKIARATEHFKRAMELTKGRQAAPLVTYAENVAVARKDKSGFQAVLNQALRIDVELTPEHRELNVVLQRRARWLLGRTEKLFP